MTTQELVQAVREYAKENYEKGGWDYVIECFSDEDIVRNIEGAKTTKGAIKKISKLVGLLAERRQDAVSEVF